jgi:hypothetical protein
MPSKLRTQRAQPVGVVPKLHHNQPVKLLSNPAADPLLGRPPYSYHALPAAN